MKYSREHDEVVPESPIEDSCLRLGLPKWPAMLVQGDSVTPDQAREIIRRTDVSFLRGIWGNQRDVVTAIANILRMPISPEPGSGNLEVSKHWEARDAWVASWGPLDLSYIGNDWVCSTYVYGPNGWCHPDGTISYLKNVGKWPSVSDLARDWIMVAEAFPFLSLTATFFDRESCEDDLEPVFTLSVMGGSVTAYPGGPTSMAFPTVKEVFNYGSECGLPRSWFEDWAKDRFPPA